MSEGASRSAEVRRGAAFDAPLTFERQLLGKPWGGADRLRRLGVPVPDSTGEVWLLSDVEGRPSRVASGRFAGASLRDLVREHPGELLGGAGDEPARFPLLVKLLEVQGRLSVQVHPDGEQARRNGDGPTGKFEAWAVLDAAPESRVSLGLAAPLGCDEVRELVASERLQERLNSFPPRPGDAYVIRPGTIHAASGGVLFLEVQETADVTYRLYDWGVRGPDGRPRELHVEKALACAELGRASAGAPPRPLPVAAAPGVEARTIVPLGDGAPFSFEVLDLQPGASVPVGGDGVPWVFVGVAGEVRLVARGGSASLSPAVAALWPASLGVGELVASGSASVARVRPRSLPR